MKNLVNCDVKGENFLIGMRDSPIAFHTEDNAARVNCLYLSMIGEM